MRAALSSALEEALPHPSVQAPSRTEVPSSVPTHSAFFQPFHFGPPAYWLHDLGNVSESPFPHLRWGLTQYQPHSVVCEG